jgi:hypothetical protein
MAMTYGHISIPESAVPVAASPVFQHLLGTYASETNKVASVWREVTPEALSFRPHPRSSTVEEIMKHQLLSERRFFLEFLGSPEPPPHQVLPEPPTPGNYVERMAQLALPRLAYLAPKEEGWWLEMVPFFEVRRQRIWIFWRSLLHTAHHRSQLAVCLRLLGKRVPSTYGPTADVTWAGADPTTTADAAGR